jgi:two-component system NtrC family sensor kinase
MVMAEDDVISVQIYNRDSVEIVRSKTIDLYVNEFIADNKVNIDDLRETVTDIHKSEKNTRFFEVLSPIFVYDKLLNIVGTSVSNDETDSRQSKDLIGAVRIIVSFASIDKELTRVSNIVTIISIGIIFFGLGLSLVFVKILLGSLEKLVVGAQKISTGDFSYMVPSGNIKEIEYLINAFNSMGNNLEKTLKSLSDEKSELIKTKSYLEEVINDMKIMQEKLLDSEKFASIGKLAATLAHEIKNPLASLQNIMFFFSQTKDFSDEKSDKMLKMFFSELNRSNRIISELLTFSRLGNVQKTFAYVDDVIHNVVLTTDLPENIKIEEDFERVEAEIDSSSLIQALEQLIMNAKDSMPKGGTIYISVKCVENFVAIKVKDTGIGIKADILKYIWDPLFTTKLQAAGIGLSIVKKIVDLHFGTATVTSDENKGSEFTINIPLTEKMNG